MYVILDANGRRMVLPRATPEQAIAPLTRAIAGAKSTADERRAAWQVMNRTWPNYAKYEQRTRRTIKVFELAPLD